MSMRHFRRPCKMNNCALPVSLCRTTQRRQVSSFIAPTPAGAFNAWDDIRLQAPSTTWTWADYNIYNNVFANGTSQGGVNVSGRPVLPLANRVNAYPLSGTAFMELYSCYNVQPDSNRVTKLRNFLNWYFNAFNPTLTE